MFAENHLDVLFPTGLWIYKLEDYERLNAALAEAIYGLVKDDRRKPTNFPDDVWQTEDNLHTLDAFKDLAERIEAGVAGVLDFLEYDYDRFEITGMWGNVYRTGNVINEHTHHNNFLSGVYYVRAPANCGGIWFKDPRGQTAVLEPKIKNYNQFNAGYAMYDAVEGALYIFPSWLEHKVQPNQSGEDRISISFNAMLRGEMGSHTGLNHLNI
jgi:uncharacterized protein (TIGR02466 family)